MLGGAGESKAPPLAPLRLPQDSLPPPYTKAEDFYLGVPGPVHEDKDLLFRADDADLNHPAQDKTCLPPGPPQF